MTVLKQYSYKKILNKPKIKKSIKSSTFENTFNLTYNSKFIIQYCNKLTYAEKMR